MYKGFVGVERLNVEMQARLNKSGEALRLGGREIRVRDKVMQVRNNYEKDVFNGDIGSVVHVDPVRYGVVVLFDGRTVSYDRDELDDLTLAYAVSVHKAQGSEYLAVVLPLLTQHFIMLQRNLFYTALTRAKKLSVVVGSYKALYIAIKNDKPIQRNSVIKEKLLAALDAPLPADAGPFDLT
jgi:exodeoxyribonuclease V alpha subunit